MAKLERGNRKMARIKRKHPVEVVDKILLTVFDIKKDKKLAEKLQK